MHTYVIFKSFSPVNLPYVSLILGPATEPKKEEGKVFFLPYSSKRELMITVAMPALCTQGLRGT